MDELISRKVAIKTALEFIVEYLGGAFDEQLQWELKKELENLPSAEVVDSGYLCDWFINSVGDEEPVWTEEHIDELTNDFYVIPKNTEVSDGRN